MILCYSRLVLSRFFDIRGNLVHCLKKSDYSSLMLFLYAIKYRGIKIVFQRILVHIETSFNSLVNTENKDKMLGFDISGYFSPIIVNIFRNSSSLVTLNQNS